MDSSDHQYDSDSFQLLADSRATTSITNSLSDYVSPPQHVRTTVEGVGGPAQATFVGTVQWTLGRPREATHCPAPRHALC